MPESRGRDHEVVAEAPRRPAAVATPNPSWWVPTFVTLLVLGLLWIVVFYISGNKYPIESIGNWNLGVGFVLLMCGFIMTMRWR